MNLAPSAARSRGTHSCTRKGLHIAYAPSSLPPACHRPPAHGHGLAALDGAAADAADGDAALVLVVVDVGAQQLQGSLGLHGGRADLREERWQRRERAAGKLSRVPLTMKAPSQTDIEN